MNTVGTLNTQYNSIHTCRPKRQIINLPNDQDFPAFHPADIPTQRPMIELSEVQIPLHQTPPKVSRLLHTEDLHVADGVSI